MRTMQRAVAMVGLTLMTGGILTVSATAASAAPSKEKASQQTVERHGDRDRGGRFDRGRDRVRSYGWYRSRDTCRWAAWVGERRGKFDDARCVRIGRGYVLFAEPEHRRGRGR